MYHIRKSCSKDRYSQPLNIHIRQLPGDTAPLPPLRLYPFMGFPAGFSSVLTPAVLLAFWQACEIIQHIRMFSQFHCKANGKLLIIYHFHHLSISFSHLDISYTLSCEICAPIKVRIFNIL